jgi:flagellar FliL protein
MADRSVDVELEKKEPESGPPQAKKINKWVIVFLGLILLIGSGTGAIIFFTPGILPDSLDFLRVKGPAKEKREAAKKVQGHIYNMEPFIVNLADQNQPRYLKIRISLESKELKVNEEYEKRLPQLRDTILTILSSKSYKEIFDSEGKKKLRDEITSKINQLLSSFKMTTVYFTEFMIQ